ncbi:MAG: cell division protein SepF [Desertimonas sp.]
MEYLGLGPDDAYDDYDEPDEPEPRRSRPTRDETRGGRGGGYRPEHDEPPARPPAARPSFPSRDFDASTRRGQALEDSGTMSRPRPVSSPPPARPAFGPGPGAEPSTVRPRRFDQAQELADKFKDGQSVILNLESTDREVARRLIDFASGVCYSLDGTMEKVATGVYLLKPAPQQAHRFDDYED